MGPEIVIPVLSGLQWLAAMVLLSRLAIPPKMRRAPASEAGEISVIIPARNEESNLEELLASLRRQQVQAREVIVVDDGSEDGTAEVAARAGANVVDAGELPEGWRGKPWACMEGARVAQGRLLLFLDADCRLSDNGLQGLLDHFPGGALACCPWHVIKRPYEECSAIFNLMMAMGTIPRLLCGPCLLVDRDDYAAIGGHSAARGEVLENVTLSTTFTSVGVRVRSIPGRGIVSFRMYPEGMRSLVAGWTKGCRTGASAVDAPTLLLIILWVGGLVSGMVMPFVTSWGWWIYFAFAVQMAALLRRVGSFSLLTAAVYPGLLVFYLAVFLRAMGPAGRSVQWKGRVIHGN